MVTGYGTDKEEEASPDAATVGPVSDGSRVDHQMTSGLLEEEVILATENTSADYIFLLMFFCGLLVTRPSNLATVRPSDRATELATDRPTDRQIDRRTDRPNERMTYYFQVTRIVKDVL